MILRQAKSSWADGSLDDGQRPRNGRGESDAPRVGGLIRRQSLLPDLIVSSDAVRAETTARAVAAAAGYDGKIQLSPDLYHATPAAIVEVVRKIPDSARTLMIVGHKPGLEDLVAQLTGQRVELPTAALVHISLPVDRWADVDGSREAKLVDIWHPRNF